MKKTIIYGGGTLTAFILICLLVTNLSKTVDRHKTYFLEAGDSLVTNVQFDSKMRFDSYRSGGRLEYRNDSIFLEGDRIYDKYGEPSQLPSQFVATYDKEGIVNSKELMDFVNAMDSSDIIITKVTVK